jgi:hypothetical protein
MIYMEYPKRHGFRFIQAADSSWKSRWRHRFDAGRSCRAPAVAIFAFSRTGYPGPTCVGRIGAMRALAYFISILGKLIANNRGNGGFLGGLGSGITLI